jgi:hypothetical protein
LPHSSVSSIHIILAVFLGISLGKSLGFPMNNLSLHSQIRETPNEVFRVMNFLCNYFQFILIVMLLVRKIYLLLHSLLGRMVWMKGLNHYDF